MKIKNNKKIVTIIGITSVISLGTIGFAAWQINGNVAVKDLGVSVTFGDVTSNTLVATEDLGSDKALAFDGSGDNQSSITSPSKVEDLQFVIKYKVKKSNADASFTKITFNFADDLESLITGKYIVRPYAKEKSTLTIDSTQNSKTYYSTHDNPGTYNETSSTGFAQKHVITKDASFGTNFTYNIESTFVFKWGATFNGNNPDQFDNDKTGDEATKAQAALNNFKTTYDGVNDKTIKLTITPLDK